MVGFFRSWCEELILASFIVSILEMLVQEGNVKKYIRVIVGIYIIFVIIHPIIEKINNIDLSTYFNNLISNNITNDEFSQNTIPVSNMNQINDLYKLVELGILLELLFQHNLVLMLYQILLLCIHNHHNHFHHL